MKGWLFRAAVSALVTAVMACDGSAPPPPSATPAALGTVAPSGSGRARLATADQQRAIVQALERSGARVASVMPSKFDWLFGNASPTSAIFQGTLGGQEFWVDVHFLTTSIDNLTACSKHGVSGETEFTVSVNGQPQALGEGMVTGYLGSTGPMYFAKSDRVFVMTPHELAINVIRGSLAVSPPPC